MKIEPLTMEPDFTPYASYRPIIPPKESLLKTAAETDASVTLAFNEDGAIVGVAVLRYPLAGERWHRVGPRIMMEVAVIEVCRTWRSLGISKELLSCLVKHALEKERIFYMVGYSWTWDIAGTGMTPVAYRNMMIRLFSGQGFRTFQTNEPNIMMRPENLFMARIGDNVPENVRHRFKWVRFDMEP